LLKCLEERRFECDYVFITGDIANQCSYGTAGNDIAEILRRIAVDRGNVFWAVGNHDIKRGSILRKKLILPIRTAKNPSKEFAETMADAEMRPLMTINGMAEYLEHYKLIFNRDLTPREILDAHICYEFEHCNIVVLNTCLTSCDDCDEYTLMIAEPRLSEVFESIGDRSKPLIAIGHHGMRFFHSAEENRLSRLFVSEGVDLYLCGHSHHIGRARVENSEREIPVITCGGGLTDTRGAVISFMHGEYDPETFEVRITPYSYSSGSNKFEEDYSLHCLLAKHNNCIKLTRLAEAGVSGETLIGAKPPTVPDPPPTVSEPPPTVSAPPSTVSALPPTVSALPSTVPNPLSIACETLFDIVTCNPFTADGRKSLNRLGLGYAVTTENFFHKRLDMFADSKYRFPIAEAHSESTYDSRDYSSFAELRGYSSLNRKLVDFETRFFDGVSDVLYVLGASGSGKSVYIQYLLWKRRQQRKESTNTILLSLDEPRAEAVHAQLAIRPPKESASWLFCLHLLDTLCERLLVIATSDVIARSFAHSFNDAFGASEISGYLDTKYHDIMDAFSKYIRRDASGDELLLIQRIIEALYGLVDKGSVYASIKQILWALTLFAYCEASLRSEKMTVIVIDNIGGFATARENRAVEIYDEDIRMIATAFSAARGDLITFFRRCGLEYSKHIKVVFGMRRSSIESWFASVHSVREIQGNLVDITGWFDFGKIVEMRMKNVLHHIRSKYPHEIDQYIDLFGKIANDSSHSNGGGFVEMATEMYDHNVRRTARAMSAIAFKLHSMFYPPHKGISIGADDYSEFWKDENAGVCRFLLRRALLEQAFSAIVAKNHWKNMLLDSEDPRLMSLPQRVLSYLSRRSEKDYGIYRNNYISIESLIRGVFVCPGREIVDASLNIKDHFLPLAKVLLAMNQPSFSETAWTPLCVLAHCIDLSGDSYPEEVVAQLMEEIWKGRGRGTDNAAISGDRARSGIDRGIRLTRAGSFFLRHISDYSFYMASLETGYIPLLYNSNHAQVMRTMNKVFEKAKKTIRLLNEFDRELISGSPGLRKNPADTIAAECASLRNGMREE